LITTTDFVFPKLTHLEYYVLDHPSPFSYLEAPSLEKIEFGNGSQVISLQALAHLMPGIKERVHTLQLYRTTFDEKALETFCLTLPALKCVKFHWCHIPASFFCFLMPKSNPDIPGAPLVDSMTIQSGDFCINTLTALLHVKSIASVPPSPWKAFENVTLSGTYYEISPEDLVEFQTSFPDIIRLKLDEPLL